MFARLSTLVKMAVPAVLAAALSLTGCLKSDETITLYPDGSGKIQLKTTLLGMMAQMAKMGGMPGEEGQGGGAGKADPFKAIKDGFGGKVYWANLKAEDGPNGEYMLSGTGYFENVNDVQRKNGKISFQKDPAGEGHLFELAGEMPNELSGGPGADGPEAEQQKQMQEMMKGMLAGFDMKVTVVMPGAVKTAEGMKPTEGRNAVFALTEKDVLAIMDKKMTPPKEMKVTSGAPGSLDTEIAAFKEELAKAKAASAEGAKPAPAAPKGEGEKKAPEGDKGGEKKGGQKDF